MKQDTRKLFNLNDSYGESMCSNKINFFLSSDTPHHSTALAHSNDSKDMNANGEERRGEEETYNDNYFFLNW